MKNVTALLRASLCGVALLAAASAGRAAEDEYLGLPDAPGREEVAVYCGPCHSLKLVVQQGQTREGWSELLTWMYDEQEMERLDPGDEKLVLDYLAKHWGPDSHGRRLRRRGILR